MNPTLIGLSRLLRWGLVLLVGLGAVPALEAERIVLAGDGGLLSRVLVAEGGSTHELLSTGVTIEELVYLVDGRLLGVQRVPSDRIYDDYRLVEILGDGTIVPRGMIEAPEIQLATENVLDLKVDAEGRLFYLAFVPTLWRPPLGYTRLLRLDPETGATLTETALSFMPQWLARAPSGLWAQVGRSIGRLDPESGEYTSQVELELYFEDGDIDAAGRLWLVDRENCPEGPCFSFHRLDPETGERVVLDPAAVNPAGLVVRDLALQRGTCGDSSTALCLQGGRFRAELEWRNAAGVVGPGRLTRARSADSGVFWLFDPANWEVNVKVLDGCAQNGHFWVFASGSTNVGLTLTVTDLEREVVQTYDNPLGTTMKTVTDTSAFPCQ